MLILDLYPNLLNVSFEQKEGIKLLPSKVNIKINKYLKEFILQGGFDIE